MWETDGSRADWTAEAKSEPQMNFYFFWRGGERRKLKFNTHPAPPFFGLGEFLVGITTMYRFPPKNDLVLFRTF